MVEVLFVGGNRSSVLMYDDYDTPYKIQYRKHTMKYPSLLECRAMIAGNGYASVGGSSHTSGRVYNAKTKEFLGFIDGRKWYFKDKGKWYWQFIGKGGKLDSYYGRWDVTKSSMTGYHYR